MKNTIRTGIDECRKKLREEGYTQLHQPFDNEFFTMRGKTEDIRDVLVSSGKFEETDKHGYRGRFRLISTHLKSSINLETNILHGENAQTYCEEIGLGDIKDGWVYSTIHDFDTLDTIEDLLSVAEERRIPMQVYLNPNRKSYDEMEDLRVYLP